MYTGTSFKPQVINQTRFSRIGRSSSLELKCLHALQLIPWYQELWNGTRFTAVNISRSPAKHGSGLFQVRLWRQYRWRHPAITGWCWRWGCPLLALDERYICMCVFIYIYYMYVNMYTCMHACIKLHYITFHIALQYNTLRYITLHYTTLHYITLHYTTLHYTTLHYITLHYIKLNYIALHCIALYYIALHYITLHYITLH